MEFICHCGKVYKRKSYYDKHVQDCEEKVVNKEEKKEKKKKECDVVKPFLKWVGGKTQIIGEVLSHFPHEMNNYHEPFLGGGSVLLGLLSYIQQGKIIVHGRICASDINSNLIGLYHNIQKYPTEFIKKVSHFIKEFQACQKGEVNRKASTLEEAMTSQESYYFWIRSRFNKLYKEERRSIDGSAMLYFMNKTCFRGVYREGPSGFNVPFGNNKNPSILDEQHIHMISNMIQRVFFVEQSFTDSIQKVEKGDFMYLDPPYAPENEKSFVSYTMDGFNIEAHQELFGLLQKKEGWLMSNANVPLVTHAFPPSLYPTQIISCRRAIHSTNPESKTEEVLISRM